MLSEMLDALSRADRATARHCAAVARYARDLCQAAGGTEAEQQLVHAAGLLHDVGKITFPQHIFTGQGRLAPEDWEVIRRHPEQGALMIVQVPGLAAVAELVLCHHERPDGRGYPRGLRAEQIPWLSRMISVSDTYDVMTSRDSYRQPVNHPDAVAELRRVRGTQLDGRLVRSFIQMLEQRERAFVPKDLDVGAELQAVAPSLTALPAALGEPLWGAAIAA
jgi:putative nucleotidyltransferase with HDIG domain